MAEFVASPQKIQNFAVVDHDAYSEVRLRKESLIDSEFHLQIAKEKTTVFEAASFLLNPSKSSDEWVVFDKVHLEIVDPLKVKLKHQAKNE